MRSLSIDTSSNLLSVALAENQRILTSHAAYMERGQGEALIPVVQQLCTKIQWDISSLNQVVVAVGPGSFTGVRIALAAARGIGLSLQIPVIGVTNFDALIQPHFAFPLCVALDTKRGDFYVQQFETIDKKKTPQILSLHEIADLKLPVITDKPDLFAEADIPLLPMPDCPAENMIDLVTHQLIQTLPPEPLYLREADVTLSPKCQSANG